MCYLYYFLFSAIPGFASSFFLVQALPGVIRTNSYCGLESASSLPRCDAFVTCFESCSSLYDWATCMEQSVRAPNQPDQPAVGTASLVFSILASMKLFSKYIRTCTPQSDVCVFLYLYDMCALGHFLLNLRIGFSSFFYLSVLLTSSVFFK